MSLKLPIDVIPNSPMLKGESSLQLMGDKLALLLVHSGLPLSTSMHQTGRKAGQKVESMKASGQLSSYWLGRPKIFCTDDRLAYAEIGRASCRERVCQYV